VGKGQTLTDQKKSKEGPKETKETPRLSSFIRPKGKGDSPPLQIKLKKLEKESDKKRRHLHGSETGSVWREKKAQRKRMQQPGFNLEKKKRREHGKVALSPLASPGDPVGNKERGSGK